MNQATSTILMIRPVNFGFNEQTAGSNAFQNRDAAQQRVQESALNEFDTLVSLLGANGLEVIAVEDTPEPHTPDSIFPNNWVSFHNDGTVFLYPMMAENRRLERRKDILLSLEGAFKIKHVIDMSHFEQEHKFLEGTGSMVLDRENKITYACVSPRTEKQVLDEFCNEISYEAICFNAVDEQGKAIYHTNVLMCIGSKFVVICLDSIVDKKEKDNVILSFKETHKEVVAISFEQMNHFAGNMLEVTNKSGETLIVMSDSAFIALNDDQVRKLEQYGRLVHSDIHTIENNGGGSARCMIAEVHLPVRD